MWHGLFSTIAMYGCPVWMNEVGKVAVSAAIDRAERAALYGCFPFCRTVSTAAMQVLGGYLPWKYRAEELDILYKIKRGIKLTGRLPCDIPDNVSLNEIKARLRLEYIRK